VPPSALASTKPFFLPEAPPESKVQNILWARDFGEAKDRANHKTGNLNGNEKNGISGLPPEMSGKVQEVPSKIKRFSGRGWLCGSFYFFFVLIGKIALT